MTAGRTLSNLIEVLSDVEREVEGSGERIVRVNDEDGEVVGYITGIDLQGGVPWLSFRLATTFSDMPDFAS